jgi:hypothetical protein
MTLPAGDRKFDYLSLQQEFAIIRATYDAILRAAPEMIPQHQATIAASLNRLAMGAGLKIAGGTSTNSSSEEPMTREQSPGLKELLQWLDAQEADYEVVNEHAIGAPVVSHYGRAAKLLRFFHSEWSRLADLHM